MNGLYTLEEVHKMITSDAFLSLAADEKLLAQLPKGNWIGGTTPYFMDKTGQFNTEKIYVSKVHESATQVKAVSYDEKNLESILIDRYQNGFTLLILPPFQKIHKAFAWEASKLPNLYDAPIIGWMAGMNLNAPAPAKTFNGQTGETSESRGVALHVSLPEDYSSIVEVINIHEEMEESPEIQFLDDAFDATNCLLDGKEVNLASYITEHKVDIKAPLVTDYAGAKINVSFKEVLEKEGKVDFYAPVFKGRTYKFGSPVSDYAKAFEESIPHFEQHPSFSCNCILNYIYGELENQSVRAEGPITFGEIGYILLNQTLTYLVVSKQ